MNFLTTKQRKLYNKLCDYYNANNVWKIASLQEFIYSKVQKAIREQKESSDLFAVYNYSQIDF